MEGWKLFKTIPKELYLSSKGNLSCDSICYYSKCQKIQNRNRNQTFFCKKVTKIGIIYIKIWHTVSVIPCWNHTLLIGPMRSFLKDAPRFLDRMSQYILASILPSIRWSVPTPLDDMHPHTIICMGCLIVGTVYLGSKALFLGRHTCWRSDAPKSSILLSSVKTHFSHSARGLSTRKHLDWV